MPKLKEQLLQGEKKIVVWGSGFVGGTTAMAFAAEGVPVLCYDINKNSVIDIKRGTLGVTNLEYWYGATMKEFVDKGLIEATHEWKELKSAEVAAHFVCVPTEKDGEPWDAAIEDVLAKIQQFDSKLVIIESTLTPGRLERFDTKGLAIGIAPRRDWFHSPDYNLKNLKRIYAADHRKVSEQVRSVLSIVCDYLIEASSTKVAALVKSVENSLLHIPAVYATQLAHAYPNTDIDEVLALAATHWRIPRYYPSFGTGGYCIPVSSKYVQYGAENPEALTIVQAALRSDATEPYFVAEQIIRKIKKGKVCVLGISYKGDLKVHQLSPALKIIERLSKEKAIQVAVHDPYYSAVEIRQLFGNKVSPFTVESLREQIRKADAVVLVTDHKAFGRIPRQVLATSLKPDVVIYDNYGIWSKHRDYFSKKKITYFKPGYKGWAL